MQTRIATLAISVALSTAVAGAYAVDAHSEQMALSLTLFKTDVRTVLVEYCVSCHGGAAVRSRFDLTTREGLLAGGAIGVSVIPGNSKDSPLIRYLTHRGEPFMPPEQPQLSDEAIARIARWIDLGAAYDKPLVDQTQPRGGPMQVTDAHRKYWAFAPLQDAFP